MKKVGVPTKTVLAFMVKFTIQKYRNVVCLIPVNKFDTGILSHWFNRVMMDISSFHKVLAVCANNHICNRYRYVIGSQKYY